MTTPDTQELIEVLEYFANRKTIDERLHGRDTTEWDDASVERRIEIMGENKRKHDAAILRAREALSRARSADGQPVWGAEIAARHEFGDMDNEAASARISAGDKDGENPVERPGNVETATPPDDLVEVVESCIYSQIRLEWHGHDHASINPRSVTLAAQAVLQALSPHLSEREKIVAWLRRHHEGELSNNLHTQMAAKSFADAISRGDHISGEGR